MKKIYSYGFWPKKKYAQEEKKYISILHVQKENLAPLKSPPAHAITLLGPSLRTYYIFPSC